VHIRQQNAGHQKRACLYSLDATVPEFYCRRNAGGVRSNSAVKFSSPDRSGCRRERVMNHPIVKSSRTPFSLVLFGAALAAASVVGQQSKPTTPSGTGTHASNHIACWKQVGISPAVMQQRKAIMEAAKSKLQDVCKDDSLTAQQKKEQIHQIHQEAMQQAEALIPAAQMEALKKCQATNSTGAHPARTTGPCGEPLEPADEPAPEPN
jgi:hypothetical protein